MSRYSRQTVLSGFGGDGQQRLGEAVVAVVGLGALGSAVAEILARAGVGKLRLIDRDILELHNLQRQSMFTESDVSEGLPKAEAARRHLAEINSEISLEAHVADLDGATATLLLSGADVIADGTDNYETRYLLNDYAVKNDVPWVYGGVLASEGMTAVVRPGEGPCLRCLFSHPPEPGSVATCETAGVWSPTVHIVAALEASAALQLLLGETVPTGLVHTDPRTGRLVRLEGAERREDCPACGQGRFEFLDSPSPGLTIRPCGGGSVHITPPAGAPESGSVVEGRPALDLDALAQRLAAQVGAIRRNPFLVQFMAEECEMTVFADGRALIKGTEDAGRARGLYSRFVGI